LSPLYDSVYITPRDKLWYDTLNSTIDYNMEYEFLGRSIDADYVLCTLYVQEMSSVLLGTDNGLIGVDVTTMDMYTVDLEYYLEDGEFIKDIYRTNNIIYLATDKRIFISYNFGINWYLLESSGMPSGINKIIGFSNKLVLATNSGIYYKFSFDKHWVKSIALNNVKQMLQKNGIFSISENKLYYSSNGVNWSLRGNFGGNVVNNFNFLKTLAFFATNSGLQNDSGTIFGTQLGLSLVDLSENILTSGSLKINDIAVSPSENQYVAGTDDGYYFVWDSSDGLITKKTDSYLDVIHKIIYIDDNIYWMFGNGFLKSNVFPKPIKLSNGTPF
jgi:WD40 repeat protein